MGETIFDGQESGGQHSRQFRRRIIPATLLFLIGAVQILGGAVMAVGAVFINLRYGWIVPNPDTRTLNSVALTHANLTLWQLWFWSGVVAIGSAFAWLRGRWKLAWGTTGLWWLLAGLYSYLTSK